MHIRLATSKDLDLLVPLFDEYRKFYRRPSDLNGARRFLKERFELKESIIYIALQANDGEVAKTNNSKAVGFTQLYPIFSSVSMERMYLLNDLFIDPNYRRQGIGQALIDTVKERCRKEGQKGIVLQTEITNPAQNLYERLGFTKDPDLHYFWATKK